MGAPTPIDSWRDFVKWLTGGLVGGGGTSVDPTQLGQDAAKALAFAGYMAQYNLAAGAVEIMRDPVTRGEITRAAGVLTQRIRSVGFPEFRGAWRWARLLVGLQGRLFIEQILWDLGDPWRTLVTGFKPVGHAEGQD